MDFNDRELVNNTDVMKLVSRVCYLGEEEKKRVFNISFVFCFISFEIEHFPMYQSS